MSNEHSRRWGHRGARRTVANGYFLGSALIEYTINTARPFLAVHGDELTGPEADRPSPDPLRWSYRWICSTTLFGHACRSDCRAVAVVVRLMIALDDWQRAVALVLGEPVRFTATAKRRPADRAPRSHQRVREPTDRRPPCLFRTAVGSSWIRRVIPSWSPGGMCTRCSTRLKWCPVLIRCAAGRSSTGPLTC